MKLTIRKAVLQDIEAIRQVAERSWNDTYEGLIPEAIQEKFLERAYSDEFLAKKIAQALMLVAEDSGEIIGFANAFVKGNTAELGAIYLLPERKNEGIGTKLLTAVLDELDGVAELAVEVEKGNRSGENFYKAKGFVFVKEYEELFFGHPLKTKQLILPLR